MLKLNFTYVDTAADLGWVSGATPVVHRCREQFHNYFRGNYTMIFRGNISRARRLFTRIEDKIGVPVRKRVRFLETSRKDWMEVKPGWWHGDSMRFSLFTVLLRASRSHTTIQGALKYRQLAGTKDAFLSFLAGNVNFIGGAVSGWNGWRNRMGRPESNYLLVNSEDRNKIAKLKRTKKVREIISSVRRVANNSSEAALIHCLSKNGCF